MSRSTLLVVSIASVAFLTSGCLLEDADGSKSLRADDPSSTADADFMADGGGDAGLGATADGGTSPDGDAGRGEPTAFEPTGPVTEEGPYEVGYREFDITYQAQGDGTDEPRTLNVSLWYPTREEPEWRHPTYAGLLPRREVEDDATVVNLDEMPLMVFSHGNGGLAEQNYFQTEFFATHGWVVVSPDHTGNTFKAGADINYEAGVYRPQDITALIDHMRDLPEDEPLRGRLSDEIVMSGHSFGGYTTLANSGAAYSVEKLKQACDEETLARQSLCKIYTKQRALEVFKDGFHDTRIDVAIPQTPGGGAVFREGLQEIEPPTLLMTGEMDQTLPNEQEGDRIWGYMAGDEHRRLNLLRGGHFTFSNMCNLLGTVDQVANDGCGDDFIEVTRAQDIINTYALAFARVHLFEDVSSETRAIVDGERFPHDEEEFEYDVGAEAKNE